MSVINVTNSIQLSIICNLVTHVKSKHEGIKYSCNQCGKRYARKGALFRHIKSKHKSLKYICPECLTPFSLQDDMENHFLKVHDYC